MCEDDVVGEQGAKDEGRSWTLGVTEVDEGGGEYRYRERSELKPPRMQGADVDAARFDVMGFIPLSWPP
jgi:hypothetical protein